MVVNSVFMEAREIRAMAILAKGDLPKEVSKENFIVPSQSGNGAYKVSHIEEWTCSCPDFINRGVECKHIKATKFFLKLRNKTEVENFPIEETIPQENDKEECLYCHSKEIVKNGTRKTSAGIKQRYACLDCKRRFVLEPIKYVKADAKIVVLTLDLYYKGLSLRDISDTIFQFYNQRIHFDTIRRWIQKYTKQINDYTTTLKPELSGKMNTDEIFLKCKKKQIYEWNSLDKETRFVLASTVTKGRGVKDAREHFQEVKKQTQDDRPTKIYTDGLNKYPRAIKKEFRTVKKETEHIAVSGIRARINNNRVERYHNNVREFDKIRRGWKSVNSAKTLANGHKIYHNFVHKHMTLGRTPAEQAGITLELGNNKWLSLIKKASQNGA